MSMPTLTIPQDLLEGDDLERVHRATSLEIADDETAKTCRELMDDCRRLSKARDEQRKQDIAPLQEAIKDLEGPHKRYCAFWDALHAWLRGRLETYRAEVQRRQREEQQRQLAEYNRKQAEENAKAAKARAEREEAERKAQEERDAAERAQNEEERRAHLAAATSADKQAVKADAKAQESMTKAATLAPEVVHDTSKEALGQWRDNWTWDYYSHGKPKGTDVFGDDEDHEFFKPELSRYWVLDERRLNKDIKAGIKVPIVNRINKPIPVTKSTK